MEKRDKTTPQEKGRTASDAASQRRHAPPADHATGAGDEPSTAFEWQAVLLRYLPDPCGSQHSVKRFTAR